MLVKMIKEYLYFHKNIILLVLFIQYRGFNYNCQIILIAKTLIQLGIIFFENIMFCRTMIK